jgi:hypothetical protein
MTGKYRKLLSSVVLIIITAFAAIVFASTRPNIDRLEAAEATPPAATQPSQSSAGGESDNQTDQTRRALLTEQFRAELTALGDRIEKPGKERLTLTGTLQRADDAQAGSFVATYQQPGLLRFEGQAGTPIVYFNGERAEKAGGSLTAEEEATVELLVYDTPEGFFNGQMDGVAMQLLGRRFRADDGSSESYAGPYYDIYQVTDRVKVSGEVLERSKLFYFNSDTRLLEIVRYQVEANGTAIEVEVRLENWQKSQDQMLPMRLVRLENGQAVLTFTVTSAEVGARAGDLIFTAGQ